MLLLFYAQVKPTMKRTTGIVDEVNRSLLKQFDRRRLRFQNHSKIRVVDLALNQSETLVSPIFRSVPSVAACFRKCIYFGDKSATLELSPKLKWNPFL